MGFLKGLFRSRDKPKNKLLYTPFWFGLSASGKAVNERTALQITAVYACVRVLSESIAGLPLHVYRHTDNGKKRAPDQSLYSLLHDAPNPEMTSFVWREVSMEHLLLYGNAYSQIIRNGRGQVVSLYPLLPNKVSVERTNGVISYTYSTDDNGQVKLRSDQVLHIPGLGFDGLIGYSPIALAKNAIGMSIASEEYGSKFFANGANPGGIITHPGTLGETPLQNIKESWNNSYGGSGNAQRVAVLEEGMTYHQIGIPPEQAQFLETRKFQTEEIARIFRVPLHLIGDLEHATFSNIEHMSIEFVKYTLAPWVSRWEQSLTQSLLLPTEKDIFIRFNLDGLLRGDYKSRMEGYSIGIQNGIMSVNDVRELEDLNLLPPEEGGDLHMVNGNMLPLSQAGQAYTQQPNNKESEVTKK